MQKIKILLSTLLITQVALADITAIKKGDVAPYEGVLFSTESANELRKEKLDYNFALKEKDNLTKENGLVYQRIELANKEIERLNKENTKSTIFGLPTGFVGGVVTTIVLAFAVKKTTQ